MLPIWHFNNSAKDKSRISFLVGYIYDVKKLKDFFNITNLYDFTALTSIRKNSYLSEITKAHKSNPNTRGLDEFYSSTNKNFVVLRRDSNISVRRITGRIQRLFAPRFYHDRKNTHFLRGLKFVGEKKEIDEIGFSDTKILGRKLYEYSRNGDQWTRSIHPRDLDWPFPDKFYSSIGFTVHGFSFTLKNAPNNLSTILNLSNDLINIESNLEEVENTLTDQLFYPVKKDIKEKIEEYNAIPTKNFINESYFYTIKAT